MGPIYFVMPLVAFDLLTRASIAVQRAERTKFSTRIDFIGLDLEKHPPMENAVKIVKWSGTFTAKLKLQ
jgi:hypothetical protein